MQRSSGFYAANPVAAPKVVETVAVKQEQSASIKQEAAAPAMAAMATPKPAAAVSRIKQEELTRKAAAPAPVYSRCIGG
ncbi:unnamed protein product [Linum trigynum]|uniref:Uncharacterized protein n=1 Tax=Linum trigynum TaxID=586398 RepID=A0AAV2F4S8_9ROSI